MASRALAEPAQADAKSASAPVSSRHRESPRVRTALKLSSPGDAAEREAESTARRVVAMRSPPGQIGAARSPRLIARAPVVPVPQVTAPGAPSTAPAIARPPDQTS